MPILHEYQAKKILSDPLSEFINFHAEALPDIDP